MANTLAIHLAMTTHGTWLHGDPRGSWFNGRLVGADQYLEAAARVSLSADAVILSASERAVVAKAFGEVVREHKHRIYAATIQPTHVHLIFAPLRENVTNVVARLKRRSSMAVRQSATKPNSRAIAPQRVACGDLARQKTIRRPLWTAGKFPVFIFDEFYLGNAIEYVRDHNRRIDLPADPFDWIEPLYAASGLIGERVRRSLSCEELPF
jgi:REP element-mobilizing transposase RayT